MSARTDGGAQRFGAHAPIYSFSTENLAGYLPGLRLRGKSVLTVCGSGDQIFNVACLGASTVTAFDVNEEALWWCELKRGALSGLEFDEYKTFFLKNDSTGERDNKNALSYKVFHALRPAISSGCADHYERLYQEHSYDGFMLRNSSHFNNRFDTNALKIKSNCYLGSEASYRNCQRQLMKLSLTLLQAEAADLSRRIGSTAYDVVLLSNLADYANEMYAGDDYLDQFVTRVVAPLRAAIKPDGWICAAYVYASEGEPRSDIDKRAVRDAVFRRHGFEVEERSFDGVRQGTKDMVVLVR